MGEFDWLLGNSGGGSAVTLAGLRRKRLEEEQRNLAKQGRGFSTGGSLTDVAQLQDDLDEDPDTGLAAQKHVADVTKQRADEAAYMAPGTTDVRQSKQRDKMAELLAVPTMQGQNALELERLRGKNALEQQTAGQQFTRELQAGSGATGAEDRTTVRVNPKGQASLTMAPEKLTTEQSRAMGVIGSMEELAPQYDQMMREAYPGIERDPASFSSMSDMFGAKVGGMIYKAGHVPSPQQDHIDQLTGYFEALVPRMLANGRINREQYEDLKKHAPQLGLSPGANYLRTKYIMDKILPAVITGQKRAQGQPAAPTAGADAYSDPNWGR